MTGKCLLYCRLLCDEQTGRCTQINSCKLIFSIAAMPVFTSVISLTDISNQDN